MEIPLNLWTTLGSSVILISVLPIHEHGVSLYLIRSLISLSSVL